MSYTKHIWQNGETITAEKLNNLEDGASNSLGPLIITINHDSGMLSETAKTIYDSFMAGRQCILVDEFIEEDETEQRFNLLFGGECYNNANYAFQFTGIAFTAELPDNYPVAMNEGGSGDSTLQ